VIRLPFADRLEAGRLLAHEFASRRPDRGSVVLGLARGGLPVANEIANRQHLALDVVVVRKIGVPWQPELAMGAIAGDACILDDELIRELEIPNETVVELTAAEKSEMQRREAVYHGLDHPEELRDRPVILVDDGLATGSTMAAAVRHVRNQKAANITVAIPVAARGACQRMRNEAEHVVCLAIPNPFLSVGRWYRNFPQLSDIDVQNILMESRRRNPLKHENVTKE
jgi:putative phosphoribosyl transferase